MRLIFTSLLVSAIALSPLTSAAFARGGGGHGASTGAWPAHQTVLPTRPASPGAIVAPTGGAPISGTLPALPGSDPVSSCVHSAGMAGLSGTAGAGPYVHSCAFGR